MREWAKGVAKEVTLELVYEVMDERTKDIYDKLEKMEAKIDKLDIQRQEDFRYLNQKTDTQIGQPRQGIGERRQETGQLRQEMDRINQRLDTTMQDLMDIVRK